MAVENVKSGVITGLDTIPVVPQTTGEGGPGYERVADAVVAASASATNASTYRVVRLPSNAKVKALGLTQDGTTTGTISVGAAYSDSTVDGTSVTNQGALISATAFMAATAMTATANTRQDILTNFSGTKRLQPLWQALALAQDPGGFIDVLITVTVSFSAAATNIAVSCSYVD